MDGPIGCGNWHFFLLLHKWLLIVIGTCNVISYVWSKSDVCLPIPINSIIVYFLNFWILKTYRALYAPLGQASGQFADVAVVAAPSPDPSNKQLSKTKTGWFPLLFVDKYQMFTWVTSRKLSPIFRVSFAFFRPCAAPGLDAAVRRRNSDSCSRSPLLVWLDFDRAAGTGQHHHCQVGRVMSGVCAIVAAFWSWSDKFALSVLWGSVTPGFNW